MDGAGKTYSDGRKKGRSRVKKQGKNLLNLYTRQPPEANHL
jgi:hypothetical protein